LAKKLREELSSRGWRESRSRKKPLPSSWRAGTPRSSVARGRLRSKKPTPAPGDGRQGAARPPGASHYACMPQNARGKRRRRRLRAGGRSLLPLLGKQGRGDGGGGEGEALRLRLRLIPAHSFLLLCISSLGGKAFSAVDERLPRRARRGGRAKSSPLSFSHMVIRARFHGRRLGRPLSGAFEFQWASGEERIPLGFPAAELQRGTLVGFSLNSGRFPYSNGLPPWPPFPSSGWPTPPKTALVWLRGKGG